MNNYRNKILCTVYVGPYNGKRVNGIDPSNKIENRSIVYLCPTGEWEDRYRKNPVSKLSWSEEDYSKQLSWADEHVRSFKFIAPGRSVKDIIDNYNFYVDYPFEVATEATLIEKPARENGGLTVPEGVTRAEMEDAIIDDPSIDVLLKARYMKSRFEDIKDEKDKEKKFPRDGEVWL